MAKSTGVVDIHGKQYKTVALRVNEFRQQFLVGDGWGIQTKLLECSSEQVVVQAYIVDPKGVTVGSGLAQETWTGQINRTSALENCETSAIGRALASIGFAGEEYASANEVQNAVAQQNAGKTNQPGPTTKPKRNGSSPLKGCGQWHGAQWSEYLTKHVADTPALHKLFGQICQADPKQMPSKETSEWEHICGAFSGRLAELDDFDSYDKRDDLINLFTQQREVIDHANANSES